MVYSERWYVETKGPVVAILWRPDRAAFSSLTLTAIEGRHQLATRHREPLIVDRY